MLERTVERRRVEPMRDEQRKLLQMSRRTVDPTKLREQRSGEDWRRLQLPSPFYSHQSLTREQRQDEN
jgi:hypothetical protein